MPWRVDVCGILHMHECNLRRNSNMPLGDMHGRADVRGLGIDVFAKSDVRVLPVLYRHGHLRIARHMHRTVHMSRHGDMPGRADL